ncbi:MAG TPA: carboxypeptidase-like regulatory domain-containing protein [Agriterribacter sp.]|nr:carboxypeptidase-like regulatory domain-containing protein [Agriterribacter sp.]
MPATRTLLVAIGMLISSVLPAQQKFAVVSGRVVDTAERPLAKVTVAVSGTQGEVLTSDSGSFSVKVPAAQAVTLTFSFTGFHTVQRSFYLSGQEHEKVVILLRTSSKVLQEVIVKDNRDRMETGLIRLHPKHALTMPSATGGVESLIKIFVGSNNELTSQYTVRGGNYDENLVYVNDFEIFRPYLVRSGQQEGLSFINPELTGGVSFYNGGFQAKYGDKMSSVLDIQYKKPKRFAGAAYIGLLEQGFHVEGASRNEKFTYLAGVRNRSNRNLLSAQETKGNYIPSSSDIQALLTYRVNSKWQLELLGNLSGTTFTLIPEEAKLTSSVLSPLFSTNLGLDIFFEGKEQDRYLTNMLGLSVVQQVTQKMKWKWMLSRFENREQEAYDITGAYLFGERSFDKSQPDFGSIINPLGAGVFINHARNTLAVENWNISHKGWWNSSRHFVQWGVSAEKTLIADRLSEWEAQDSAGYNLPYQAALLPLYTVRKSSTDLDVNKLSGYIQDNITFGSTSHITVQGGLRFNYNGLNKDLLLSPRVQMSWMPDTEKDWVLKIAAGAYDQPPFYRELRRYDGSVNTAVKA